MIDAPRPPDRLARLAPSLAAAALLTGSLVASTFRPAPSSRRAGPGRWLGWLVITQFIRTHI
ncbi:MAG TPA: hypothetical protein VNL94_07325 [Candidatus Binatia bacterium]|nr:hypothetical protein [Candidatus Binatia bacterium]